MLKHLWEYHRAGKKPQVINLAAGLDGRAYRSDLNYPPGTTIYEIDRQEVSVWSWCGSMVYLSDSGGVYN